MDRHRRQMLSLYLLPLSLPGHQWRQIHTQLPPSVQPESRVCGERLCRREQMDLPPGVWVVDENTVGKLIQYCINLIKRQYCVMEVPDFFPTESCRLRTSRAGRTLHRPPCELSRRDQSVICLIELSLRLVKGRLGPPAIR